MGGYQHCQRALPAGFSHRGVDRKRNDRLGGPLPHHELEHRRQIQCQHRQLDTDHNDKRTSCPIFSHGCLDWQRDDCLGRALLPKPFFEQRRQILRAIRSDANAYVDSHSDTYSNTDHNIDCDAYGYIYTKTFANSKKITTAQATPDSAAAPLALIDEKETHCSFRLV